ncbi:MULTISPECIES: putative leader peptide [Actinotalea]
MRNPWNLSARLHVDLRRQASASCPGAPAVRPA